MKKESLSIERFHLYDTIYDYNDVYKRLRRLNTLFLNSSEICPFELLRSHEEMFTCYC